MPIRVRWNNVAGQECTIRPTPLISIVSELNQTGAGDILGVTYKITLNGKLLPDEGTPYALKNTVKDEVYPTIDPLTVQPVRVGPFGTFDNNISHFGDNRPPRQNLVMPGGDGKEQTQWQNALMMKQRSIRALFANHGQRMEITDVEFDVATLICFPRIVSVSFAESQLTTSCDYTVELEADSLWTYAEVDPDGNRDQSRPHTNAMYGLKEIHFMTDKANAYIKDFSESWNIEVDESKGEVLSSDNTYIPRSYRITHNISATGKDHYTPKSTFFGLGADEVRRLRAWEQAKKFVTARLASAPEHRNDTLDPNAIGADRVHNRQVDANDTTPSENQTLGWNVNEGYPNKSTSDPNAFGFPVSQDVFWPAIGGRIGAGTLDLIKDYNGFNHTRTESIDETAGSYSVVETWLLASGTAYENYTMSVNTALGDPFVKVSINGNVKGLTQRRANDQEYGGGSNDGDYYKVPNQYENALNHYNGISNNQLFGVGSMIYKRANNQTQVQLNAEPKSVALSVNEFAGEITYALEFDNRPTNIISNTVNETISINDTYPGDVFATIPVIGRTTGPVLQYIGGRTEYRRDVAVNLTMDYTKIPYGSGRSPLLLAKPSVNEPTATEIANLLDSLSPANEPGIRKYFISAPTESWEPKTGNYNFNISFTYELDK